MLASDLYFGVILLVTLLLTIAAQCPHFITCRCGNGARYYTHCVNDTFEENNCERWMNCKTCATRTPHCLTCPEGHSGPTCKPDPISKCSDPGTISFGSRRLINGEASETNGMFIFGQSFQYFCNTGYELVGNNVLTCLDLGQWTSETPSCRRIFSVEDPPSEQQVSCRYPDPKPNSRLISSPGKDKVLKPGTYIRYACYKGYNTTDPIVLTCLTSGQWNFPTPTCTRTLLPTRASQSYCIYPDMDETGMIIKPYLEVKDRGRRFPPGSNITFDCEDDFDMVGEQWIIYCKLRGGWSSKPPSCKLISSFQVAPPPEITINGCSNPIVDPNGVVAEILPDEPRQIEQGFDPGSAVRFTCNEGFEMEGNRMIVCLQNGRWNNPPPTCKGSTTSDLEECTDPGTIPNGGVVVFYSVARANRSSSGSPITYPVGTRLSYDCIDGYILKGERQLYCRSTGEWSREKPSCVASKFPDSLM